MLKMKKLMMVGCFMALNACGGGAGGDSSSGAAE
tara:strand:- start:8 stop:109 length:102 start_codon:yes stop_codon:yes gene_type:complete